MLTKVVIFPSPCGTLSMTLMDSSGAKLNTYMCALKQKTLKKKCPDKFHYFPSSLVKRYEPN